MIKLEIGVMLEQKGTFLFTMVEVFTMKIHCYRIYTNSDLIGPIGPNRPKSAQAKPQPNYMRNFELDGKSRHFQSVTTDY